jgi:excisionase family DNA binding protein
MEPLYSVEEAARRLGGVSKWTVHAWLSKGKLKRTKVGERTMIRESELLRFLEECNTSQTPPNTEPMDKIAAAKTPRQRRVREFSLHQGRTL